MCFISIYFFFVWPFLFSQIKQKLFIFLFFSVVIMCMSSVLIGGEDQRELLLAALDMGMVSDGYVFIPYDALLYAMPYQVTNYFNTKQIYQYLHQTVSSNFQLHFQLQLNSVKFKSVQIQLIVPWNSVVPPVTSGGAAALLMTGYWMKISFIQI